MGVRIGLCQNGIIFGTPFIPTSFSGLQIWLDGTDVATITSSSGACSAWTSKDAGTKSFTQATSGNRPAVVGSGLTFDGINDVLVGPVITNTQSTTFVTWTPGVTASLLVSKTYSQGSPGSDGWAVGPTTGTYEFAKYGLIVQTSSATQVQSARECTSWVCGADLIAKLYINGVLTYTGADTTALTTPSHAASIGGAVSVLGVATDFAQGIIHEIISYDRALTFFEMNMVDAYIRRKWGTP